MKISVIIPVYNSSKFIYKSIESVLDQTFLPHEIIVIDDGSTDNTAEIVSSYKDIVLFKQSNKGPSAARNLGMDKATGNWIAFLDADDIWGNNKLQLQKNIIDNYPQLQWVSTAFTDIRFRSKTYKFPFHNNGFIRDFFVAMNCGLSFKTSTILLHKNIYKSKYFRFNTEFRNSEDTEMWLRIGCQYPEMGYVHQSVAKYMHPNKNSLTRLGFSNLDLSFLTIERRLKKEINSLTKSRKKLIQLYLKHKREERLIRYWASNRKSIKQYPDIYKNIFSKNLYFILIILNWIPSPIKRLLSKILKLY